MVKMMWCMDGNSDDIYNIIVDNFSSWSILSLGGILFTNLVGDIIFITGFSLSISAGNILG